MPKIDNLVVFRCVQVVRRLLFKNREIGLFCNLSGSTLTDGTRVPAAARIPRGQPRDRALDRARIHAERAAQRRADREREPRRARRARLPLLARQCHAICGSSRASSRARGFRFVKVPADAPAQPRRHGHERHPSGRSLRPARPLRHRPDRREDRERGHRWSICSTTTCASARASCSRRRGRCAPRRCRASPTAATWSAEDVPAAPPAATGAREVAASGEAATARRASGAEPDRAAHLMRPRRSSMDGTSCPLISRILPRRRPPISISCPPPRLTFTAAFRNACAPATTCCSATSGASCTTASPRPPESCDALVRFRSAGRHRRADHQCAAAGRRRAELHRRAQGAARGL